MVAMRKKEYTARYRMEDGDWLVEIDEIPQVHSFGRTLAKAQANIRDALALWLQVDDPGKLHVRDLYADLPEELARAVADAGATRSQAAELSDRAQKLTAHAARALVSDFGMSVRDAAQLLQVSHQRVHQLLHERQPKSA